MKRTEISCDHYRHYLKQCLCPPLIPWNDTAGHFDYEKCDECGKAVCFDTVCENGWRWDGGNIICYDHKKGLEE